jgi:predicted permease
MGLIWDLPREVPSYALAAAAFPATTSVPLALLQALPLERLGGPGPALHAEATSLVLLYTLFMTILRWTVAFKILAPSSGEGAGGDDSSLGLLAGSLAAPPDAAAGWCAEQQGALALAVDTPVKACLAGIAIGVVTPLRRAVYGPVLRPLVGGLEWLGGAYVPVCMLILGQELWEGYGNRMTAKAKLAKSPDDDFVRKAAIGAVLVVRLVLAPLIAFSAVVSAQRLFDRNGHESARVGRTLLLVFLVESAGPPAINMVVMCALHGHHRQEMASTMLVTYPAAFVTLLLWTAVFMHVLSAPGDDG